MKKTFFSFRRNMISLAVLLLMIVIFSACKKTLDTVTQPPVAGLMAFNLVPDKTSVGISLSGQNLTNSPLFYTNYTGGYLGVYIGNRDITSYDLGTDSALATTTQLFADSSDYSLFVLGANGHYKNLIVKDNLDSLPTTTGQAFVRYVNAIADSTQQPAVSVSSGGTPVINNNAPFATVSDFKAVTPGDISVKVSNEGTINSSRTITVEQGKIYTILLVGIPGQTDSAKAVQIKFIQNGIVSTNP